MNKNLLILGAGQYGSIAKEVAEAMNVFEKIDFLDDNIKGTIGKLMDYEEKVIDYNYGFVAIGNSEFRLKWIQKLQEVCYQVAVLVHPKAYVSPSAQLMRGTCVEPMAVVHTNVSIKIGCFISAGAVINHDALIGDVCHINCNAIVESEAILLAGTTVNCGSVFTKEMTENGLHALTNEKNSSVTVYHEEESWVQQHIKDFGTIPTFF